MSARLPGTIITFYSYKGGTGRSMALANVAWILASNGKRVLAVDWDLEAPGLHRYFAPFLPDPDLTDTEGLIDFCFAFALEALTPPQKEALDPSWHEPLADLLGYAVPLDHRFPNDGSLDFVCAGKQDSGYAGRVNSFNWERFYEGMGGGAFLETVRRKLGAEYQYVLLDSRTGVSDTSGVCTVQMPDTVLVCFTANNQSIDGAAAVAASIRAQWDSAVPVQVLSKLSPDTTPARRARRLFPVMMRVEKAEKDKLRLRREYARKEFASFLDHLRGVSLEDYWFDVDVLYDPYYAYEEVLAVFGDNRKDQISMLPAMQKLTGYLTDGDVRQLNPPTAEESQSVLAKYARRRNLDAATPAPTVAHDVFVAYGRADRGAAQQLADQLQQRGLRVWFDQWHLGQGLNFVQAIEEALRASAACVACVGPSPGEGSLWSELLRILPQLMKERGGSFRIIPVLLSGADPAGIPDWLRSYVWADLRASLEDEKALRDLVGGIRGVPPGQALRQGQCPYPGARPFDVEDAPLFFGREKLTQSLLERLRPGERPEASTRLLTLVGQPRSGSSSLARAGLIASLKQGALEGSARWPVALMRPGRDPLESLAVALAALTPEGRQPPAVPDLVARLRRDTNTLHQEASVILSSGGRQGRVVLLVDQLEEALTLGRDESQRRAFLGNLFYAAQVSAGQTIVILTLRADSLSQWAANPEFGAALETSQVRVEPLTVKQLLRAVVEPARLAGDEFEPELAERIVKDVLAGTVSLPLMQRTLVRLWERREGIRLTRSAYEALGGLAGQIADQAEDVYQRLNVRQQAICRRICLRLIQPGNEVYARGRRVALADLRPVGLPHEEFEAVLSALLTEGLVQSEGGHRILALQKDLLFSWSRLHTWIDQAKDDLFAREELAARTAAWYAHNLEENYLYQGDQLERAKQWIAEQPPSLTAAEVAFLDASQKLSAQRGEHVEQYVQLQKRLRLVAYAVCLNALVLGSIAALYYWSTKQPKDDADKKGQLVQLEKDAQQARAEANVFRLTGQALEALREDRQRGLLLATEAFRASMASEGASANLAENALREALGPAAAVELAAGKGQTFRARVSPGGRWLAVAANDTLRLWDLGERAPVARDLPDQIRDTLFDFSPDGAFLITADRNPPNTDNSLSLWRLGDPDQAHTRLRLPMPSGREVVQIAVSPRGHWVYLGGPEAAELRGVSEKKRATTIPLGKRGAQAPAAFSSSGRWLATSDNDSVTLWDLASTPPTKSGLGRPDTKKPVRCLAFSPGGDLLAASRGQTVWVWNLADDKRGEPPITLEGLTGEVLALTFSEDNRWLAAGDMGGAQLYDLSPSVAPEKHVTVLSSHKAPRPRNPDFPLRLLSVSRTACVNSARSRVHPSGVLRFSR
jgi:hypothetical protein